MRLEDNVSGMRTTAENEATRGDHNGGRYSEN
jgi:hypothetical protein